jgi:hypothetical protein
VAPARLADFIATLSVPPRDAQCGSCAHLLAEDLAVWAHPDEVIALLQGAGSAPQRLALVKGLAVSLAGVLALLPLRAWRRTRAARQPCRG